jgi:protein-disulfide isomerase
MGTLELRLLRGVRWRWALLLCAASGCTSPAVRDAGAASAVSSATDDLRTPPPRRITLEPQASAEAVPVDADDAVWGDANAPITVVVFTDLQCPFCAEGHQRVVALERRYGEARLRVVLKHLPLSAHEGAVPAARIAQAVLFVAGRGKFFEYVDLAFQHQDEIAAGRALGLVKPLGIDPQTVLTRAEDTASGKEVLGDVLLADRLQVSATPHYRVNGRGLTGVRPLETFIKLVDGELAAAAALLKSGVAPSQIYAARVRENLRLPEP